MFSGCCIACLCQLISGCSSQEAAAALVEPLLRNRDLLCGGSGEGRLLIFFVLLCFVVFYFYLQSVFFAAWDQMVWGFCTSS